MKNVETKEKFESKVNLRELSMAILDNYLMLALAPSFSGALTNFETKEYFMAIKECA